MSHPIKVDNQAFLKGLCGELHVADILLEQFDMLQDFKGQLCLPMKHLGGHSKQKRTDLAFHRT